MRNEKEIEHSTENATGEEMSAKDTQNYDIACGISFALGIVAYAVAWIVGSCIYNLGGYDLVPFGMTAGGMCLFFVGVVLLFVYIICVAGKGKPYDDILWTVIWVNQVFGMVMFAAPSIVEKVV